MNLEQTLVALKEAFTGKSAEAEASATELASAKEALAAATAENATFAALVESVKADKVALEAKVASLEAELAKATDLAKVALEAQKAAEAKVESAGKKAAAIAASVGVDAVEVTPAETSASAKTNQEIADQWVALKKDDPKAASEFYTKNRSAILAAAGLR